MQEIRYQVSADGKSITSTIALDAELVMRVRTRKGYRGWLTTVLCVFRRDKCGDTKHSIWDYRQPLQCERVVCNPNNARRQHERALRDLAACTADVRRHYSRKGRS